MGRCVWAQVPLALGLAAFSAPETAAKAYAVAYKLNDFPRSNSAEALCPAVLDHHNRRTRGSGGSGSGSGSGSRGSVELEDDTNELSQSSGAGTSAADSGSLFLRMVHSCLRYNARVQREVAAANAAAPADASSASSSAAAAPAPSPTPSSSSSEYHSPFKMRHAPSSTARVSSREDVVLEDDASSELGHDLEPAASSRSASRFGSKRKSAADSEESEWK